jgi:tetratricopeptide (TPR) repeat protein
MFGDDLWSYIPKNSFEAVSEGKIKITNVLSGKCYLGFQNPSFNSPIKVVFEATAITETVDVNMNEWAENSKNELFNLIYSIFKEDSLDENTTIDLTNCVVEKITNQLTPLQLNIQKSESEKKFNEIFDECYSELEGGLKTDEQNLGSNAGSMGWYAFENGNIDKAIQFSEKALSLDSTLGWVHGNLGLFYLIKGEELKSFDYYLNAIKYLKLDRLDGKEMMKELIKDIDNALIKFPNMINPLEIRRNLESEAKQN